MGNFLITRSIRGIDILSMSLQLRSMVENRSTEEGGVSVRRPARTRPKANYPHHAEPEARPAGTTASQTLAVNLPPQLHRRHRADTDSRLERPHELLLGHRPLRKHGEGLPPEGPPLVVRAPRASAWEWKSLWVR